MTANQGITWDCKYYNDTGATLTFGDSAKSNVMCIYMGQYYPAESNNPDVVDVAQLRAGQGAGLSARQSNARGT